MPAFQPCAGTRAQIDATPVANGRFLVATDTGEAFIDFNNVRIRISGTSGGGGGDEPPQGDEDDDSLATLWSVVNAAVAMSDSVPGGGPGGGVLNAPVVTLEMTDEELATLYSIAEA